MKKRIIALFLLLALVVLFSCNQNPWDGEDCTVKWAGIRYSEYGIRRSFGKDNFPRPDTTSGFMDKLASCYEGSSGACILIVGTISREEDDEGNVINGKCSLTFPLSKIISNAKGSEKDFYDDYLTAMDKAGHSVWLQVESGDADLVELATEVMTHYKDHPCVKGFGIDVEWYKYRKMADAEEGTNSKVSNELTKKVLAAVRAINPEYTVFVKHWEMKWLPSKMDGLIYVNDSQQFDDMDQVISEFSEWASAYAPQPVMFQIGYDADTWIWNKYPNPAREFGQAIVDECKSGNDIGIIWVDFTLSQVINKTDK